MTGDDLLTWPDRAAALEAERQARAAWRRAQWRFASAPRGKRRMREAELRQAATEALKAAAALVAVSEPAP